MVHHLKQRVRMSALVMMLAVASGPIEAHAQGGSLANSPKTWSCTGNKWVVNGEELRFIERGVLSMALRNQVLPAGCYWYDPMSGMIGREGAPPGGDIPAGLNIGGPLRPEASNGDSNIFLNGREITRMEAAYFMSVGIPLTSGWYWMNHQGIGGREGYPAEFQLPVAAAQRQAPARSGQWSNRRQSQSRGEYLNQSANGYGGIQGNCAHASIGDLTIMSPGCN